MTLRKRNRRRGKHLLNFLHVTRGENTRRRWLIVGAVVLGFLVLLGALGYWGYRRIGGVESLARAGEQHFREAQTKALDLDFIAAKQETDAAVADFTAAYREIAPFRLLTFVPYLGRQIAAADNLIIVARESGSAIRDVLEVADTALTSLTTNEQVTPNSLTDEERSDILRAIADGKESLTSAEAHLDEARIAYHKIPVDGLAPQLTEITAQLSQQFPLIDHVIAKALPFTKVLPGIAGYPNGNRYVFLLQNNQELRPTGGFIGTYGILEMHNGAISEFTTDNVYNLDEAAKDRVTRTAPEPLAHYLGAEQWFFRDANWSPDFPTTAETALHMYEEESRDPDPVDGVIAVTPVLLKDLLGITGPLTVDGVEFTEENAIEELRFQVDRGFVQRGEVGNERKDIIGRLGQTLVGALENLPQKQWPALWSVLLKNIESRHVLMYFRDAEIQEVFHAEQWDGSLVQNDKDYFFIVDANLASLKTDSVITRAISYTMDLDANRATLTMTYTHTGEFSSTITRYRTYLRIYVPAGSTLISSFGFSTDDSLHAGTPVDGAAGTDLGRTVFQGFVGIEPGTTHDVTVTYSLPEELAQHMRRDGYELYAQKQAGLEQASLTADIKLGKTIARAEPANVAERTEHREVRFSVPFAEDQQFIVE